MPGRSGRDEMQNVKSYGAPLGTQEPINATDRPKVGPASPEVQHAALEQQGLYRKPVGSSASKPAAPATPAPSSPSPTSDLSVGTAAQRIQQYPGKLNEAIEDQSK